MFPVRLSMPDGEQFNTYTAKRWPLGTRMDTQDGRSYRYAENNTILGVTAVALVAGDCIQAAAPTAGHVNMSVDVARAAAARVVSATSATNAGALNDYLDGFVNINVTPGLGYSYMILSHLAWTSTAVATLNLAPGHAVQVALSTASRIGLTINRYRGILQTPVTTATAETIGVAVKPIALASFGWLATKGINAVHTGAQTLVNGDPLFAGSGATAGRAQIFGSPTSAALASANGKLLGFVINGAPSSAGNTSAVALVIDG